jgi:hypothetical protein
VVVDALWDALGVPRAPSAVVATEPAALDAAARGLDRGDGTVWAGDAGEGCNGGAVYLRWVRGDDDAAEAAAFLAAHCDRARVMPFLEGIPCSIHGMVFPRGVAAFRPVEMVILRRPGSSRLRYAGAATFWDPPDRDRAAMRELARRVGEGLRERVGYRGAFTVDGVLTVDGFLPTELNPRLGAGLAVMTHDLPELPVVLEGGACRPAEDGERPDGVLSFGPSGVGGFVRLALDPARVPAGPPVAPLAVAAFALADQRFGTAIGPLEPARPVR